mgnify:CR=1 FL=1
MAGKREREKQRVLSELLCCHLHISPGSCAILHYIESAQGLVMIGGGIGGIS